MKSIAIALLTLGFTAIAYPMIHAGQRIQISIAQPAQPAQPAPASPTHPPASRFSTASAGLTQAQLAENTMSAQILVAHNQYREALNLTPLTWSERLSSNAQEWAQHLADRGGNTLEHAQNTGEGENLWLGTADAFSLTQMVEAWGEEKQYFQPGTFPDVSTTGNWSDVGHYTQIIWRDTTQVGCAIATGGGNDILVCRYSPPGNFIGQPVY